MRCFISSLPCLLLTAIVVGVGGMTRASSAEQQKAAPASRFPLRTSVAVDHTYLRAGPSEDFYPTARLIRGEALELWSVDATGYGAVRPMAGSFSWVRAADIDTEIGGGDGIGVVIHDGAISRIGSQINDLRHVAQVRLEAGERVRVLDEVRIATGRHAGLWLKIAPPSGEFRWARLADLDLPDGLAPATTALPAGDLAAGVSRAREAVDAWREAGESLSAVMAVAGERPEEEPNAPQSFAGIAAATKLFTDWLPSGSSLFDLSSPAPPVASGPGTLTAPTDELADIDLALSIAVAGPSQQWDLASIRERLRIASARAATGTDRLRAEAIDARLARFETIKGRHEALAAREAVDPSPLRLGSMWSSLAAIGSRPIRPGVLPGGRPADGQPSWTPPDTVETTGRLATVVSRRPDAPRWAIVDDNNNVLAFVAPAPGVHLAPLVGQQVSVRGAKGYMPEYKRPYLVASEARTRIAGTPPPGPR
jgi:hypothetical protein